MKSQLNNDVIESLPEFLVHALELELESVEHYHELADVLRIHNNPDVAELFEKMAGLSEEHANDIKIRTTVMKLPKIAPWDFKWGCPGSPESGCMDEANYLMSGREAVELALFNESQSRDFYLSVADTSPDADTRALATEMAAEEQEHVDLLNDWLKEHPEEMMLEDLDPPNMPE